MTLYPVTEIIERCGSVLIFGKTSARTGRISSVKDFPFITGTDDQLYAYKWRNWKMTTGIEVK